MSTRRRRTEERAAHEPYRRREKQEPLKPNPMVDEHAYAEGTYDNVVDNLNQKPEVVSTSQAINLTCTLAALSSLFALFLYFNDTRSRAVRRVSVQSIGLGIGYIALVLFIAACQAFFGMIPIIGVVMGLILWVALVALSLGGIYIRIQMMKQAYQGYAFQLPVIGDWIRRFE